MRTPAASMSPQLEKRRLVASAGSNTGGDTPNLLAVFPSSAAEKVLSLPRKENAMWCQLVSLMLGAPKVPAVPPK